MADQTPEMATFLSRLDGVKPQGDGWMACCPAHDDSTPSMSVCYADNRKILAKCHANCDFRAIVSAVAMEIEDFFPPGERKKKDGEKKKSRPRTLEEIGGWPTTKAIYEYHDEQGRTLFLVQRQLVEVVQDGETHLKKTFKQWRAVGNGKFVAGMGETRRVLFHLPQLIEAVGRRATVHVVEGEKDVLNIEQQLGLVATCNVGGAAGKRDRLKWPRDAREFIRGVDVVILPDNDEAGRDHAERVAENLAAVATTIKIVPLPGLEAGGDVSDWIAAGGTREQFEAIVAAAPTWDAPAPPAEDEFLTDVGNAKRMVRMFGSEMRYNYATRSFYVWTGARWEVDDTGHVERLAKKTVLSMLDEAADLSGGKREELEEHSMKSQADGRLRGMLNQVRSEVPVRTTELDSDVMLFNCLNGTIELETGALRPHRREDFVTKLAPVEYDPNAKCPLWHAFLNKVMDGNEGMMAYLQRAAGYILTGLTTEECFFLAHGGGRNGKGTFVETLVTMLGDYATKFPSQLLLESKNESQGPTPHLARLKGARFAHASEITEGRRLAESFVKEATGSDTLTARFLNANPIDFVPTHKLFLAANHKPIIKGNDNGIWSRIHLIPFTVFIPKEERDKNLKWKLRQQELPGILRWAVEGCLMWQQQGLCPPEEVVKATQQFRDDSDSIGMFFEDCCERQEKAWTSTAALYKAFTDWAEMNGKSAMSSIAFGRAMPDRGLEAGREFIGRTQCRVWVGIRLRSHLRADERGAPEQPPQPPVQSNLWDQLPPKPGAGSIETETYRV